MSDLTLSCWIIHSDSNTFFLVRISKNSLVDDLRLAIKKKKFQHIDAEQLVLWKLVPPIHTLDFDANLSSVPEEVAGAQELSPLDPLEAHFTTLESEVIQIIVQPLPVSVAGSTGVKRQWSGIPEESDSVKRQRVLEDAQQAIAFGQAAMSPSSAAKVSNLKSQQTKYPIVNGRYANLRAPPVTIYHPVFAQFSNAIRNKNSTPTAEVYTQTHAFLDASADFYGSENERIENLKPILTRLIGDPLKITLSCQSQLDGAILTSSSGGRTCKLLAAIAWNNGKAEPGARVGFGYRKFWVQKHMIPFTNASCCPSFLISFSGPFMCISGGVMVDQTIVQPLTDYICLSGHPDIESRVRYVAQVFDALASGMENLRRFYDTVEPTTSPTLAGLLPYPVSYTREDGGTVEFEYVQPANRQAALFEAKTKDGRRLMVKFARTYHSEAHRLLAASGLAPPIHYAGRYPGGIIMVVMDYVRGAPTNGPLSDRVLEDITDAVKELHSHNIVFGDLRRPNIMVLSQEAGSQLADSKGRRAMLVDFDWCGLDGECTYPATLNDSDHMLWHPDVKRGGIMQKEHDLYLLKKLRM